MLYIAYIWTVSSVILVSKDSLTENKISLYKNISILTLDVLSKILSILPVSDCCLYLDQTVEITWIRTPEKQIQYISY